MDALKNWIHGKNYHSWRMVRHEWYKVIFSEFTITCNYSSLEYKNWNPWKDWCESWQEFQSSGEKLPKSDKPRAAMFSEMFNLAKLTSDKLEEAKAMRIDLSQKIHQNESLSNQNFTLEKKCAKLQMELNMREMRVQNLEKEAKLTSDKLEEAKAMRIDLSQKIHQNESLRNQNLILEKKCAKLGMELNMTEKMRVQNLEKEANLRTALEDREQVLTLQVKRMENELCQAQAKCDQLEETISSFQSQLVEYNKKGNCQFNIKNDIHYYPYSKSNQPFPYKQLENGKGEKSLDLETIKNIVERLGPVTRLNVFDWLCSCDAEYRIWGWSGKDFEKILHRCTDSSIYSSITPITRMTEISWFEMCKDIAERFIPDLDDLLAKEQMKNDETVLQYFNRMWMIYRFNNVYSSRDEPEYIEAICDGLLPHLRDHVKQFCVEDEDYVAIEASARSAEYLWWMSGKNEEERYWAVRRAGPRCPSRTTIWRRLKEHDVQHKEIDGATYWDLVVRLSRYEELGTRGKIICQECRKKN
ncbi:uncharacterized protein [Dendrobates tinctorius]|uniref:uncharacterized protein n=1 Tax=Dendrobates tinctorius TaxID=92724 RepID=UPI003CC996A1